MTVDVHNDIETLPWDDFLERFKWKRGQHVSFIGSTGSGKTTLSLNLMKLRKFGVIVGTKPEDEVLLRFAEDNNFKVMGEFPEVRAPHGEMDRILLWPRFKEFKDVTRQRQAIGHGLQTMFMQKEWTVNVDEVAYLSNQLKLQRELELFWQQGRSVGLSLMAGTQRPAHVPLLIYNQPTHLFFFRDNDEVNLKRIGGIGWLNSRKIRGTVMDLPEHVFLYVNSRTGEMLVSKTNEI